MSEYYPSTEELAKAEKTMTEEQREMSENRENVLARIKTFEGGNPTIHAARELGVTEIELKTYALGFLEKDIREGYGLETIRSIAEQSWVVTKAEADEIFEKTKVELASTNAPVETEAEKAARDAAWLAEMLEYCGKK